MIIYAQNQDLAVLVDEPSFYTEKRADGYAVRYGIHVLGLYDTKEEADSIILEMLDAVDMNSDGFQMPQRDDLDGD